MERTKKKKWHRARHTFFLRIQNFLFRILARVRFGYRPGEKVDNRSQPYLFLYNHQLTIDPLFLQLQLTHQTYTVAAEDVMTQGVKSRFFNFAQAPIPFKKATNDAHAVMTCIRVVREGYSIALSPEGARSFDGVTLGINPAIAKLVKMLKLPLAMFVLRGGYVCFPRYADKRRKGPAMTGGITRVVPYDEYKDMSVDELNKLIRDEMYVDESDESVITEGRHLAEYLERALYYCPKCRSLGTLKSKGNEITCLSCGNTVRMNEYRHFIGDIPVKTVKDWIGLQEDFVRGTDISRGDEPLYAEKVTVKTNEITTFSKKLVYKKAEMRLYTDRIEVGDKVWKYDDILSETVWDKSALDVYAEGKTYQISAEKTFCAIKYVNFYYHYKNVKEGNDDRVLGI
ncbi:MAG: 1-acyl-sn-glycerol-3-phosphate acyltransferase [Clostridia bacterium]|nr:1-acyl-sn-glycerol-3-phosphate acyltransferase [Clostridia bacterium]